MRILSLILFLFTASLISGCGRQQPVEAKQDSGPVPVRIAPVVSRDVQRIVESVGTMFPFDESVISAEIDGRVDEINVDLGDPVAAGQTLIHINDEEQRLMVQQNEAILRQSLERLGLKSETDRIKDVRDAPDVRRAQADLTDADQRHSRIKSMVAQGIAAQADLDQSSARLKAAQAAYDSSLNQARNMIQAIEQYRAQLDFQRKKLRDTSVHAPFAGYVKERTVNPGQFVRVNTPLITLVKIDPIRLRLDVPERMAPWVKVGQLAEVSVEAYEGKKFSGKIWRISPTVDQAKRTFVVEVLIDNPKGALKPGSYARARVPTDKIERIHVVPSRAVAYVYGTNKAFIVNDGKIEAREVKLGDRFADDIEVAEGVSDGEQVATTNLSRLDSGVRVRVEGANDKQTSKFGL
ncbi:MAG: efflux RND transporter periplasmic adaptor subunit [Bryobacteraceae bacterium]